MVTRRKLQVISRTINIDSIVSVDMLKQHIRVIGRDAENQILTSYILSAIEYIERATGRIIANTTYKYYLQDFPRPRRFEITSFNNNISISLPLIPVTIKPTIQYIDCNNVSQTLDINSYEVILGKEDCVLYTTDNEWPRTYNRNEFPVQINCTGGYGANTPEVLKLAALTLSAYYYNNREAVISGTIARDIPHSLNAIMNRFKHNNWVNIL